MYFSVQLMIDLPLGYRQQPRPVLAQEDLSGADAVEVHPGRAELEGSVQELRGTSQTKGCEASHAVADLEVC